MTRKMFPKTFATVLSLVASLQLASGASALLTNGGFETGDFSGWTVGGAATSGVDADGTPIAGSSYADSVVNVRSGSFAAWANVQTDPPAELVLSQTLAVEESRTYDVGFWLSIGRSMDTLGAGRTYSIEVEGQEILSVDTVGLLGDPWVGDTPSHYLHESAPFTTFPGQTSVTVTYTLSGSFVVPIGFSYDDFHFEAVPCGNGVLDVDEQCDDGNNANNDCCDSDCQFEDAGTSCSDESLCTQVETCDGSGTCVGSPRTGCITAARSLVLFSDNADDNKDKIKWKLSGGGALDQMDLGDPVNEQSYTLCVFDETTSTATLVGSVRIDPSASWVSKDPKGFVYSDPLRLSDGVKKSKFKTGEDGKSSVLLLASGLNVPMPTPFSPTEFFDQDTEVTVQLVGHEIPVCWTTTFSTAIKNDGSQFKAKNP